MRAPFVSPRKTKERQMIQFRRLIRHCYENVPFYRKRLAENGLTPVDFRSLDDIAQIPVLNKNEYKENMEDFFARGTRSDRLVPFRSTGSTGEPTLFYASREYEILRGFIHLRCLLLAGVGLLDRQLRFLAEPRVKNKTDLFQKLGIYEVRNLSAGVDFSRVLSEIHAYRPHVILLTPSYLEMLCDCLDGVETDRVRRCLKRVITRSEVLYPNVREKAESRLGVPVRDFYGLSEFGFVAAEADESHGYHIAEDVNIVEIAGATLPDGTVEEKDIIVTALYNFTMPLIRYNTRDKGELSRASDGKMRFRRMEKILGRSDDFILLPDGSRVNPLLVTDAFVEIPGLVRFRVFQESTRLTITIQMKENRRLGEFETRLRKNLGELTKGQLQMDIRCVSHLDIHKTGKHRRIHRKS